MRVRAEQSVAASPDPHPQPLSGGRGEACTDARRPSRRSILDVLQCHDAIGAARRDARKIDTEFLRQRAHGRHGLHAADGRRLFGVTTRSLVCIAPTTVPSSARPALSFSTISPPSSDGDDPSSIRRLVAGTLARCRCRRDFAGDRDDGRSLPPRRAAAFSDRSRIPPAPRRSRSRRRLAMHFDDLARERRRHFDDSLRGLHRDQRLVELDAVASLTSHSTIVASGRPSPRSGRWNVFISAMTFSRSSSVHAFTFIILAKAAIDGAVFRS